MPSHPPLLPFLLSSFPSAASELRRPPLLLVLKTEMLAPPSSSLPRCAATAYDRIRLASEHAGGRRHLPWLPTSRSASTQDDGSCGYKGDGLNMLDFSSAFPLLPLASGPWAGLIGFTGRALRASLARKVAHRAVPGPSARHEAQGGKAGWHAGPVGPCLAWACRAVPGMGPCRAGPGRPVAHL
jgi:hypothetical protein